MKNLLWISLSLLFTTHIFAKSDLIIWGKTINLDTKNPAHLTVPGW